MGVAGVHAEAGEVCGVRGDGSSAPAVRSTGTVITRRMASLNRRLAPRLCVAPRTIMASRCWATAFAKLSARSVGSRGVDSPSRGALP
jgi:hypothetical protein